MPNQVHGEKSEAHTAYNAHQDDWQETVPRSKILHFQDPVGTPFPYNDSILKYSLFANHVLVYKAHTIE